MRELVYAVQFKGQAEPANDAGTVLKARTSATGCTITSMVGAGGLEGRIEPAGQGKADFQSEVRFDADGSFQESGTIAFEAGRLHFSTVGKGHLGDSANPALKQGAVIWKIDRGEGRFEGASGLITSNFLVGEAGEVTDNHFGVIFVP